MSTRLSTHILAESEFEEWDRFVSASPLGSIYSSSGYLKILCSVTGATFRILAVRRGDELAGGVGLYEVKTSSGTYVSTRLLLYYNGLVLREYQTKYPSQRTARSLETMEAIEREIGSFGYTRVVLKNQGTFADARLFLDRGWSVRPTYTYVVPLADLDALWNRLEQNLRRLINRCRQEEIQFTEDDDFSSFHAMHVQTVERKGASLYLPQDSFRRYFESLKSQQLCRLFHARLPDGRSIASQLVLLGPHFCAHTVSAAADREFQQMGANAFLRWKVFEALSAMGYTANDLTDAALGPVTHFKSQLGGDLAMCLVLTAPESILARVYRTGRSVLRLGQCGIRKLQRMNPSRNQV